MTAKLVVLRETARRDVEDAVDFYAAEAGEAIALGFIDALERAFRAISRHPSAGSPRYAVELDLPGLRSHGLRRFPYLVFYIDGADEVDVWRVLHAHRDIPAWLQESGG
ncbi:type II toxin-antitoxin system RelE/ParE family toxin [Phenylobacterium sp. LjRoot225]|uniref:type II toxin-antitoxin system RelE/ParE family toxin n=1 Tax=Phenylobacterium sp. LjRoot225 TaxID=3342285 RepID=UPI003ECEDB07